MLEFYKTDKKKTLNDKEYTIYKMKGSSKQYIKYKKEYIPFTDFKKNFKKGGMFGKALSNLVGSNKLASVVSSNPKPNIPSVTKQVANSSLFQQNPELKQGLKAFAASNPKLASIGKSLVNSSLGQKVLNNSTVQKALNHAGPLNSLSIGPSNISFGKLGSIGTVSSVGPGMAMQHAMPQTQQMMQTLPQMMQTMSSDQITQFLKTNVCPNL